MSTRTDGGAQAGEATKEPSGRSDRAGEATKEPSGRSDRAGEATKEPSGRRRKVREGIVTSIAMDKTAVVTVTSRKPHPRYGKTMQRSTKLYTHDEENDVRVGDRVRVIETRPLSKTKRWRLLDVVERAR